MTGGSAESLDRRTIRALAERHAAELRELLAAGEQPTVAAQHHQESINACIADLSDEQASAFLAAYSEEMEALDAGLKDALADALQGPEELQYAPTLLGGLAGVILLLIIFYLVWR